MDANEVRVVGRLERLVDRGWSSLDHEARLEAALRARHGAGRGDARVPRGLVVGGLLVALGFVASVVGAEAVHGIRSWIQENPDGTADVVIEDEDGRELHRRKLDLDEPVFAIDEPK